MKSISERSRYMLSGLAIVCAVVCPACGGQASRDAQPAAAAPAAVSTPAPAATAPAGATDPATGSTPITAPAPVPQSGAAGALVQDHESGAEVTLVEARRTAGDSVTVKWRYRNGTAAPLLLSKGGTAWIAPYALTAEAFLVDTVNKKKHLVITDDQRLPLASKHGDWQGVTLAPGQTIVAWAKFPAPPEDVASVTITLPGTAPFESVPVIK